MGGFVNISWDKGTTIKMKGMIQGGNFHIPLEPSRDEQIATSQTAYFALFFTSETSNFCSHGTE